MMSIEVSIPRLGSVLIVCCWQIMRRSSELPVETESEGHKYGKEDGPEVEMPLDEKGVSWLRRRIVFEF
jgi:hypothetical protein